jgi:WD40 repeat protein
VLPAGRHLGPYEIISLIGSGGMGEVYRARDPRLGREVALKVIRGECVEGADRLQRFEREARAAAALNHPNILTVHDVGSDAGTAYVVTELLEGETLRAVLSRRSPARSQVLSFAVQAAQGLAAAHQKGIVHRDLKPENLFLTTEGRVKILDFGLAKLAGVPSAGSGQATEERSTRSGVVLGTVAYMSPEQAKALAVDARSDIFSFGVVLYELLSRRHPFRRKTVVATLTAILQETPPDLTSLDPAIPPALSGIVRRCLEKGREQRFQSAHDLALALEVVLAAGPGAALAPEVGERSPYPGLSSFTERDAAVFFGREAEVEALWRRLQNRRLLALIGPSGTGKTSFVRAGVIASRPAGWGALVCTPGAAPDRNLGRALAPELAGDPDALRRLLSFEETETAVDLVGRWRRAHVEALLVVDQFEELFTLNPKESQERFAALLGRLVGEADVHVLLSMRDDFLIRCSEQEAIAAVFESLTPLTGLMAGGLRRALVEPAGRLGYRFEDGALVEEMTQSVEGSRGALPLLAFAVARLWEMRDREKNLLTRRAYEEIGGVAGALAQHAEATMERIGPERQAIVREIFRNLVTAEGTRAVAEREELLSAFPEREPAGDVLRELIDARLLTSYEVEGAEGQPSRHRVEVVHESLLKAWPRLVRWQAQDEEGAVLRDQLKQAAHLWEEKARTQDLLWTGTAYREYELWRERYPGALTTLEEDFARSMKDKARRRKRLLTAALASVIVALAGVAIAIGVSRHQATKARDRAQGEALRAEAGKLLALGRTEIDRYPTAALAYARKSLELADTPEARRFAVEVLWRGPVARILPLDRIAKQVGASDGVNFDRIARSPDDGWLAMQAPDQRILLLPRAGGPPRCLPPLPDGNVFALAFSPKSDVLVTGGSGQSLRFLSLPDLREVRRVDLGGVRTWGRGSGGRLLTLTWMYQNDEHPLVRAWPLPEGEPQALGRQSGFFDLDAAGNWGAYGRGRTLFAHPPAGGGPPPERIVGQARDELREAFFLEGGDALVSTDKAGEVRLWSLAGGAGTRILDETTGALFGGVLAAEAEGRRLVVAGADLSVHLWDLRDPPDAEPIVLKRPDKGVTSTAAIVPGSSWLATNNGFAVALWPLSSPSTRPLRGQKGLSYRLAFSHDSRWLASCPPGEPARLWPLDPSDGGMRTLGGTPCFGLAMRPAGTHVLVGAFGGGAVLFPIPGGPPRPLPTGWEGAFPADQNGTATAAFDTSGRWAAAAPFDMNPALVGPSLRVLRVWDLQSGQARTFSLAHLMTDASWWGFWSLRFAPDGSLLAGGQGGVRRLTLPADAKGVVSSEMIYAAGNAQFDLSRDGRQLLVWASRNPEPPSYDELFLSDLSAHTWRRITTHGQRLLTAAFDWTARIIVTGDADGAVRVGLVTGEEPHLLLGHARPVEAVAVSPDGRWIASVSDDVRLWPMPDVTRPPFHTLPHAELIAKLDSLTNLHIVPDGASATGWKFEVGPFPGWQDTPRW